MDGWMDGQVGRRRKKLGPREDLNGLPVMTQQEMVESVSGKQVTCLQTLRLMHGVRASPRSKKTNWNLWSLGWPLRNLTDHITVESAVGVRMWSLSDGYRLGPSHFIQDLCPDI